MKIKTELLQKMVSKAIQGASFNKMIPLTSLIGIDVKGENLTLTTTDGSNQFRVIEKIDYDPMYGPQEFYTIVNADTFSKLVGKTTKEFIELENKENYVEVRGNGTYKLEIAINEEGEMVRFPEITINEENGSTVLELNKLQEIIKVEEASVAKTMEVPCLTGYYISNNAIATDRQLICSITSDIIFSPLLISSEMAKLLLLIDTENINLIRQDNYLIFYNDNYILFGKELEGKENYPVKPIEDLVRQDYKNKVQVNKNELLNVLDRMALFVTDYDKDGVFLDINSSGIVIKSQKSNAVEVINTIEHHEVELFNCLIDIEMLKSQVETISTDIVEIQYGQEKSIKIVDGNCTHIISLIEKSN